jgi:hypothetical protein
LADGRPAGDNFILHVKKCNQGYNGNEKKGVLQYNCRKYSRKPIIIYTKTCNKPAVSIISCLVTTNLKIDMREKTCRKYADYFF